MPLIYCGRCDYCRRGLQHLCVTMACTGLSADWGGIAELANLEEYQVFRIPDSVSDEQGALIEPCAVAAYGVSRGPVRPGDSVLIAGAGPDRGVRRAVRRGGRGGSGLHDRAERVAARAGDGGSTSARSSIRPPRTCPPSCASEPTGWASTSRSSAPDSVTPSGPAPRRSSGAERWCRSGCTCARCEVDPMLWALNDLKIVGSWCYGVNDWPRVAAQIASGRLPVERDRHRPPRHGGGGIGLRAADLGRRPEDMKVLIST